MAFIRSLISFLAIFTTFISQTSASPVVAAKNSVSDVLFARNYRGGGIVDCRFTYCDPKWMKQFSCDRDHPCPDGSCCSYRGFCGTTNEFCLDGCQSNCVAPTLPPTTTRKIPDEILNANLPPLTEPPNANNDATTDCPHKNEQQPNVAPEDDKICGFQPDEVHVPWQVRLRVTTALANKTTVTQCSGVLVNSWTILASARCFRHFALNLRNSSSTCSNSSSTIVDAIVGDYDTQKRDGHEQSVRCQVTLHTRPCLFQNSQDGGKACVELASELVVLTICRDQPLIQYNKFVSPICLPAIVPPANGHDRSTVVRKCKNATLSGWGKIGPYGGQFGFQLEKNRARILWPLLCTKIWEAYNVHVPNTTLCTMADKCRGDIGSPLFGYWNQRAVLIGIASFFNSECGKPHALTVYLDVVEHLAWIRAKALGSLHFIAL